MNSHDFSNFVKKFPLYTSLKNKCNSNLNHLDENEFKNAINAIFKNQTSIHILSLICLHHNINTNKNIVMNNLSDYDDLLKCIVIEYYKTL